MPEAEFHGGEEPTSEVDPAAHQVQFDAGVDAVSVPDPAISSAWAAVRRPDEEL